MSSWPFRILAILLALMSLVPVPAAGQAPTLTSLTLNPTTVTGVSVFSTNFGAYPPPSRFQVTVTLSGPAPSNAGVSIQSSDPSVYTQFPNILFVPAGASTRTFDFIAGGSVASSTPVTITASYGGVTKTATLTVLPATLASLTLDSTTVVGGAHPVRATVTLSAPPGLLRRADLSFSTDKKVAYAEPINGIIEEQETTATFLVRTYPVASSTTVTIAASYGGVTRTATLAVSPPSFASLTPDATSVTGGTASTGTVTLSGPAPSGGFSVSLHSTNTAVATAPAVVTVPEGVFRTSFTITTHPVSSPTHVFISASYQGLTRSISLGVVPSPAAQTQQAPSQAGPLQKAHPQAVPLQKGQQAVPTQPGR